MTAVPPRVRFTMSAHAERYARKANRIVIRHRSNDRVVAVVEIVSAGNKTNRHALGTVVAEVRELLHEGIHLLLLDLHPPGPRDSQGVQGVIWSELVEDGFTLPADKPLTLAAYEAGQPWNAYVEPVAVGDPLPAMPLFLEPGRYVPVPLEATYGSAVAAVPRRWRDVLEPPAVP